jgi:hypothetical protein
VVVAAIGEPNCILPVSSVENKTTSELLAVLPGDKFQSGHLAIQNSLFRLSLDPDCLVLQTYPEIVVPSRPERFPPPIWHLAYIPNTDVSDIVFFVAVETQMQTAFPPLPLPLTFHAIDECTGSDLLAACQRIFEYECTDCMLFGRLSDSRLQRVRDSDPAQAICEMAIADRLLFRCTVGERDEKRINHRVFFCDQIVGSEKAFVGDIAVVRGFLRIEITDAHIFTTDQVQALFQNVEPIYVARKFFLANLQAQPVAFASCYGCSSSILCTYSKLGRRSSQNSSRTMQ